MRLYHGSENIIKVPHYHFGNPKNDYGYGFYCTENLELAMEWGCSEEGDGFANEYELDISNLSVLNLSEDKYNILNWLAILLENRTFDLSSDVAIEARKYILENFYIPYQQFDIIRGYRADDSYFSFAAAFLKNEISLQKLNKAMYLGKLGEQIVLKSEKAFSQLKYVSNSVSAREFYFPKKKARDSEARYLFSKMRSESEIYNPDTLFVMDLIRGGIKHGDPRIPAVLFK